MAHSTRPDAPQGSARLHALTLAMTALLTVVSLGCGGRSRPGIPPGAVVEGGIGPTADGPSITPDGPAIRPERTPQPDRSPKPDRFFLDGVKPNPDKGQPGCVAEGEVCSAKTTCCGGHTCVTLGTGLQLCARACTGDDPSTPLINEDNCPQAPQPQFCSDINPGSKSLFCLRVCTPKFGKGTCATGVACHPVSTAYSGNMQKAVCAYPACKTNQDCPVFIGQACQPGAPGNPCAALAANAYCAMDLTWSAAAQCARPGVCDLASGLCGAHTLGKSTAKVGDPCTSDLECGAAMRCDQQSVGTGGLIHARNGYCTMVGCTFASSLPLLACPTGSTCSRMYYGGRCFKSCDLKAATGCRGYAQDMYADYECRAWNNMTIGGQLLATTPVCESGDAMPCTLLGGSTLDCSSVGLQGNPTQMQCRNPKNGAILTAHDPSGLCLDTTTSGK